MLAVRRGTNTFVSMAQMFSVVVTLVFAFVVFRDAISLPQLLAVGILVISMLIMVSYNIGIKKKLSQKAILFLVLCGLFSGLSDEKITVRCVIGLAIAFVAIIL